MVWIVVQSVAEVEIRIAGKVALQTPEHIAILVEVVLAQLQNLPRSPGTRWVELISHGWLEGLGPKFHPHWEEETRYLLSARYRPVGRKTCMLCLDTKCGSQDGGIEAYLKRFGCGWNLLERMKYVVDEETALSQWKKEATRRSSIKQVREGQRSACKHCKHF